MDPFLAESAAFLESLQERDRKRAAVKLRQAPHSLSTYEKRLLGRVWDEYEGKQRAASERRGAIEKVLRPGWLRFRSELLLELNQHAVEIALQHNLRVEPRDPGTSAKGRIQTRTIHVPPVSNDETYALFLHEVGHVVDPNADAYQFRYTRANGVIASPLAEVGAWRFALKTARRWTRSMQDEAAGGLISYARDANDDERSSMVLFMTDANSLVCDRPWTVNELTSKWTEIRK